MGYTTFSIAKQFVRAGSGECNGDELGKTVNTIRRHLYNWYADVQLFADAVETFAVQRFWENQEGVGECYQGITLPRECANIEAMWWNDWPVTLRSSWREWVVGITPCWSCGLEKFDLPGFFSTALDLIPGQPKRIRFQCESPDDIGKVISIRGMTPANAPFAADYKLSTNPAETDGPLKWINRQGGIIKEATVGRVIVADEDGRLLGMYEPDETVPSYRRVKLAGLPGGCGAVNVRAARRYFPLVGANDVVETDNEPAFDAMARYLRLYQKQGKTGDDLRVEKDHYATARSHILGDKAREVGKGTRAEIKIVTPGMVPHRATLNGARGRF